MEENEQMSEERICPKCGHRQTGGEECQNCGIIFKRVEERAERQAARKILVSTPEESGAGGPGRLLMIVLLVAATAGLTWFFTAKQHPAAVQPDFSVAQSQSMPASTPGRSQTAPRTQRESSPALEIPLTDATPVSMGGNALIQARNATVSVVTPRGQGSGFFILSTYIVTNRHVVEVSDEKLSEMRQQLDKLKGQIANEQERLRLIRRNLAQDRSGSEEAAFVARQVPELEARLAEAEAMYKEWEEQYRLSSNPLTPRDIKIRFADGREEGIYQFKTSDKHDLAVLLVTMPSQNVLKAASEPDLQQGDKVFVIGNPSGLSHTVTAGIFSGYRKLPGDEEFMLQTDAPINPGNSGGPLLDEKGRVHGVNTMIIANTQGIGFAIPIKAVFDDFNLAEP